MTLSLTKLFEVKEWKCHYFWDSVIFWCWKSSLKKLNFRALAIDGFWTKKHGTKFFWSFLMRSNPCFIRFEIKNHWLPLMLNTITPLLDIWGYIHSYLFYPTVVHWTKSIWIRHSSTAWWKILTSTDNPQGDEKCFRRSSI